MSRSTKPHETMTRNYTKVSLALLARQKKSANGELRLTGMTAVSNTSLNPEGTVLVDGELWRARSFDGNLIPAESSVRVVGAAQHLLLVSPN